MAFYFALLNVSNAHLDNKLHHGSRRSRSSGNRPANMERRHSISSATSNEVVNDYRLLPRPRILSTQSVARPPTPPQRRSQNNVSEESGQPAGGAEEQGKPGRREESGEAAAASSSQPKGATQNPLRNIKKVTFEADHDGDILNHQSRRVPFLDDREAWGKGTTGSPTAERPVQACITREFRWKWVAKIRSLSTEQCELKVRPQKKLTDDANTVVARTVIWPATPPPAYPGVTDSPPTEISFNDSSEYSLENLSKTSSERSSLSELFDGNSTSKRKFSGIQRISRRPWKLITDKKTFDASWRSTKNLINLDTWERVFSFNGSRANAFRADQLR
ncbi:hypothetical protein L596_003108 [Steinernema carpocapsae]|uniref:Uncharacterized protein n=1 Tax=Steinernema carpocapsae TaxID=34508 RepID=A0A4U8UT35_STECR|nr:hypothetical protein L596_003108 [Steinernema carpocapsae]